MREGNESREAPKPRENSLVRVSVIFKVTARLAGSVEVKCFLSYMD